MRSYVSSLEWRLCDPRLVWVARQYPSEKHCAFTSFALRLQMLLIPVSALQLSGAGIFIVIIFPWKATKYLGFAIIGKIFMNFFGQLGSWILKKKKIQEILQGHFPGTISISWFYSSKTQSTSSPNPLPPASKHHCNWLLPFTVGTIFDHQIISNLSIQ